MPTYFLIVGDKIKQELDTSDTDVTALPLMESARAMSLINKQHIIALMNRMEWTAEQVVDRLGLVDERDV
jgi:hypothetical protein